MRTSSSFFPQNSHFSIKIPFHQGRIRLDFHLKQILRKPQKTRIQNESDQLTRLTGHAAPLQNRELKTTHSVQKGATTGAKRARNINWRGSSLTGPEKRARDGF